MSSITQHGNSAKDYCLMKNGKMMPTTKDTTMSDGTMCGANGTCGMKGGTKMTMKNGLCMAMNGKMTTMSEMGKSGKIKPGTTMSNMKM